MPGFLATELRTAMAAHVVERAHAAVIVAEHQYRRSIDRDRQEIPRVRNLEFEPGEQPAAEPDGAHFRRVKRRVVIEPARHAISVTASS